MRIVPIAMIIVLVATPSFAQGLLSDRRMPRPDQATEQPKKKPNGKEEKSTLEKLPDRTYDPWRNSR